MKLEFDKFTIGQLRALTEEFLTQNPDFKTAEQILKERSGENANKEI